MINLSPNPTSIIDFWFKESSAKQWYKKDASFDALIRQRFSSSLETVSKGESWLWRSQASGRLAEVIVLDQFTRNIFRNNAQAFAYDALALALAQEAMSNNTLRQLPAEQRAFLLMPFMHSESLLVHEQASKFFEDPELDNTRRFEERHREIIERFGRYPHRNKVLGRESTPAEIEFLQQPGSSF